MTEEEGGEDMMEGTMPCVRTIMLIRRVNVQEEPLEPMDSGLMPLSNTAKPALFLCDFYTLIPL